MLYICAACYSFCLRKLQTFLKTTETILKLISSLRIEMNCFNCYRHRAATVIQGQGSGIGRKGPLSFPGANGKKLERRSLDVDVHIRGHQRN